MQQYRTNPEAFRPLMKPLQNHLLTPREVAEHFRYSTARLSHLRTGTEGPPFFKLPTGAIRHWLSEIMLWQLAAEHGPLTVDRVCLAVAACTTVPEESRTQLIAHLERVLAVPEGTIAPAPGAGTAAPAVSSEPEKRPRGRPRKDE